jgi:CTP:molybdopterin cytidylyltransferase MocA
MHLGESALVRPTAAIHTEFQETQMDMRATAIVMASGLGSDDAVGTVMHGIGQVIKQSASANLNILVVAPQPMLNAWQNWCETSPLNLAALPPCAEHQLVSATLKAGVQMSAESSGWMLIPADMVMHKPSTLPMLCSELKQHLIVHATHGALPRLPIGFAQELFSELVHLDSDHALSRLMNRYPTQAVEVDDPGVLMHPSASLASEEHILLPWPSWASSRMRP